MVIILLAFTLHGPPDLPLCYDLRGAACPCTRSEYMWYDNDGDALPDCRCDVLFRGGFEP